MKKIVLAFLVIPLILHCQLHHDPFFVAEDEHFSIYMLEDEVLETKDVVDLPLKDLKLAAKPYIEESDLIGYNWVEQLLTLTPETAARLGSLHEQRGTVWGIPLVFTVGTQRIYLASFHFGYSSSVCSVPHMDPIMVIDNAVALRPGWPEASEDVRFDHRIFAALKDAGLLAD